MANSSGSAPTSATAASAGTSTGPSGAGMGQGSATGPVPGSAISSIAGGLPILTPGYLSSHRVGIPGQKDVIWNPQYDTNLYPAAGVAIQALSFFSQQQGAGTSYSPGVYYGVGPKTFYDTNLQAPNAFTLGQEFYCIGAEFDLIPGVGSKSWPTIGADDDNYLPAQASTTADVAAFGSFLNDIWVLANIGYVALKVGTDRFYIQDGPIGKFPPRTRLAFSAAVAAVQVAADGTLNTYEQSYAQPSGIPYVIVPIYLQTNQLFTLTLSFAGQIALPSGDPAVIRARLNGYLIRQAT